MDISHPNFNILIGIGQNFREFEMRTGIKMKDEDYIKEIKRLGIYDWYMKDKLIDQREQKLKRILNG